MSPRRRQHRVTPPATKPITIKEVAEAAEVSTATVSRVLSGQTVVSPELADQVQAAVKSLGYRPNRVARNLRKRPVQMIGVVVPDLQDSFYTRLVRELQPAFEQEGYTLLVCDSFNTPQREWVHLSTLRAEGVAGIILAPVEGGQNELREFIRTGPPVVLLDAVVEKARADSVVLDHPAAAAAATARLLARGHRVLGLIAGVQEARSAEELQQGFQQALAEAGLAPEAGYVELSQPGREGGYQAMQTLLTRTPPPSAVLAANAELLAGALDALAEHGLAELAGVTLVGLDNPKGAADMAAAASRLLLQRITTPRMGPREEQIKA